MMSAGDRDTPIAFRSSRMSMHIDTAFVSHLLDLASNDSHAHAVRPWVRMASVLLH